MKSSNQRMDRGNKSKISRTPQSARYLTSRNDRNVSPNSRRERSMTWSTGDKEKCRRPTISKPTLQSRSNSMAEIEQKDVAAAEKLMSQSYHAGQYIQLSVTMVGDENRPKQRRMSRYSPPRHSLHAANQNGLLNPRSSIQYGKSGFRQRTNSKASIISNDDSSSVTSSIGPPKSAWDQFSEHIREIDDGSMNFNQNPRIFQRSDTFTQCCSILDYNYPTDTDVNNRKESVDFESVFELPFSNEPRLSIASTSRSTGMGRQDSIFLLPLDVDDRRSR